MRALVAMSGGVDSSVAAALMLEAGYDVVGVTLKQWVGSGGAMPTAGCCTVSDAEDARRVAAQLGVPYYVLDYVDEFTEAVVEPFGASYLAGTTPNPCIECNRKVRFSALLDRTNELDADVLVTGHHARVRRTGDRWNLLRAVDGTKDQSYVLHMLGQPELSRIRLPIGEMTKTEVRRRAVEMGLRTAAKPDSQDICFVGDGNYRDFLRSQASEAIRPGPIVDATGEQLGSHDGVIDFTIGQRKGLGISLGEPRYVIGIDHPTATITLGRKADLATGGFRVEQATWVAGSAPPEGRFDVKVRYKSNPEAGLVSPVPGGAVVTFEEPQGAIAPGQAAVFYRAGEVIGGGTIVAS